MYVWLLLISFTVGWGCGSDSKDNPDEDGDTGDEQDTSEARVEQRIDEILSEMTVEQKAAQMIQAQFEDAPPSKIEEMCFGSVFNGGEEPVLPNNPENWRANLDDLQQAAMDSCGIPILYGIDAVHGNAKVSGATVFPHNIALGATGDADLVERIGRATGIECRAVGIHMTFAPSVSVARDERWGRTYESFGETPEINAEMGAAIVRGLQGLGDLSDPGAVAATAKHFMGDGGTEGGINNGVNTFGDDTMRTIHLPPYEAAIEVGLAAVMPSYHRWDRDGVEYPLTMDTYSITDILKGELGFDGFCLSDYDAIPQAAGYAMYATYTEENVAAAVGAGLDMAMIASYWGLDEFMTAVKDGVKNETIYEEWLDDAVRRILRIKLRMGLFENPYPSDDLFEQIWSEEHQELAREAVRKSLVLLQNNDSVLPLDTAENIVVAGSYADRMNVQSGGWTITWQGDESTVSEKIVGETILQGLQELGGSHVTFDQDAEDLSGADKVVVVLGEDPYAEGKGDHGQEASVYLSDCPNYATLTAAIESGVPVVLVILSGRPMILEDEVLDGADAIVAAWQPGSRGIGVADVLYGKYDFTGKLTHTWPATFDQIPVNVDKQDDEPGNDADDVTPLYPLGYGLSY